MSNDKWIYAGLEFNWGGQQMVIRKFGAQVLTSRLDGSEPTTIPLADLAAALRNPVSSLVVSHLHDLEDRLSDRGRARLQADRALLHIMLTGRRIDQPDTDPPAPALNPARWPKGTRHRAIARLLVQERRERGSMKGFTVLVDSEMKRIQRVDRRWRERGTLVDARYLKPRRPRTDPEVIRELLTYLKLQAPRSSKTDRALVMGFLIHCARENPLLALPCTSTLTKRLVEHKGAHAEHRSNAKNRASLRKVPVSSVVSRIPTRPGELVLFDTTKSNVWVRDPGTGQAFRLEVTLALDLATRCIVGLAITHTTTKIAVGLCLADVLRPKTSMLASEWKTDIAHDQPFIGKPDAFISYYSTAFHPEGIVVDNGKPYITEYITSQMARLRIHYEPQRSYNPTDKAQVERVFLTIKEKFESLMPGFTGGSVYERGEHPEAEDLMTPGEYERRMRQCIDLYNHTDHQGLLEPDDPFVTWSPYTMYAHLAAKAGAIEDVEYESEAVRFLPSVEAKIEPSRVRVRKLNYRSPILRELQGDPEVMRTGKLRIYYDPYDLRVTWCFDAQGRIHRLNWAYLRPGTPKFGELHTNWAAKQVAGRRLSPQDVERILLGIFAGQYDSEFEPATRGELADKLIESGVAALTAGTRDDVAYDYSITESVDDSPEHSPAASKPKPKGRPTYTNSASDEGPGDAAVKPVADSPEARPRMPLRPYDPNGS